MPNLETTPIYPMLDRRAAEWVQEAHASNKVGSVWYCTRVNGRSERVELYNASEVALNGPNVLTFVLELLLLENLRQRPSLKMPNGVLTYNVLYGYQFGVFCNV